MTGAEAWGEVLQAIRVYGLYRQKEALINMSSVTGQTVSYIGFSQICRCKEPDVIRGKFLRMYEQVANRARQTTLLPPKLLQDIQALALKTDLPTQSKKMDIFTQMISSH